LKQDLDTAVAERDKIQSELDQKTQEIQERTKSVEQEIQTRDARVKELEAKVTDTEKRLADANAAVEKIKQEKAAANNSTPDVKPAADKAAETPKPADAVQSEEAPAPKAEPSADGKNVELDKIVVAKTDAAKGRILSVDKETEFVIFDMGSKSGVSQGDVLSVMRGDDYLGDIKVSRVQEEMSAADLIPPFSSKMVRKNDTVVAKK
ncbi:MAG: hypothetical protein JNN05_09310, partial [Candidatus Omnitrophica bacterium]|nr:hypothetical protein [Candidatus Omnitrophota bacterium]